MPTIFITIPAYEDFLLEKTISGALENASNPESLRFAVALQYKKVPTPDLSRYLNQCKIVTYDVDSRPGVNFIRAELLKFYNNEDYFLMIDSHTNFAPNWDTDLIKELNALGPKSIISKQVPSNVGDVSMHDNLMNEKTLWVLEPNLPGGINGIIKAYPQKHEFKTRVEKTSYASFHFFFTYGNFVPEVGISKINNHYSEEPLLSYQAFLYGWDIYAIVPYNHIGHNDLEYNLSVYNSEHPEEDKVWGIQKDGEDILKELDLFYINNELSIFKIQNSPRKTKDFYEAIGISFEEVYRLYTKGAA
jgi:hypothetical protein